REVELGLARGVGVLDAAQVRVGPEGLGQLGARAGQHRGVGVGELHVDRGPAARARRAVEGQRVHAGERRHLRLPGVGEVLRRELALLGGHELHLEADEVAAERARGAAGP
ncbi:MAG: hypothetical protein ACK559_26335, partial [bacterium]